MDEDDLLGGYLHHEQDMRQKLQRDADGEGNSRQHWEGYGSARGGYNDHNYDRGARGYKGSEGNLQGGRGYGRGQPVTRDLDFGRRNFGEEGGKGAPSFRGGIDQRGQGAQGNWRPKEPGRDKNLPQIEGKPLDIKCFRCLELGHHQSDCTNELVCYKCKGKGHMAVDYEQTK